jgi:hypothetical protein
VESIGAELGQYLHRILDPPLPVRFEQDSQYPDHNHTTCGGSVTAAKLVDEKEISAQVDSYPHSRALPNVLNGYGDDVESRCPSPTTRVSRSRGRTLPPALKFKLIYASDVT